MKDDASFAKLLKEVDKEEKADAEAKAALRREAQDVSLAEKPQAPVSLTTMMDRQKAKAEQAAKEPIGDAMEKPKRQPSDMRGYRKTEDGKTTTFFHMDIDDEAKRLLDAQGRTPMKLDAPVEEAASGDKSAWNHAGTWESKNLMKWVSSELDAWVGTQVELPSGFSGAITVTEMSAVQGNAEAVTVRGKRRRVLDVCFHAKWTLALEDGGQATGTIHFDDVSMDDDAEVRVEIDASSSNAAKPVAAAFVSNASQGLQPALAARLEALKADFGEL